MPIGKGSDGIQLSLYAYVSWSPVALLDPDGLDGEDPGVKEAKQARGYLARNAKQALKEAGQVADVGCTLIRPCSAVELASGTTLTGKPLSTRERLVGVAWLGASLIIPKLGSAKKAAKADSWYRRLGRWLKFWKRGKKVERDAAEAGRVANVIGSLREKVVAELTGGKVSHKSILTPHGKLDVDVEDPLGSLIEVGGPGKIMKRSRWGTQLKKLTWAAEQRGVTAQVYLENGTPDWVIEKAQEWVGVGNVHVFNMP